MDENELNEEYSSEALLRIAIKDLVDLATKANNVILQGSFNGAISDDVCDVLEMCKVIHKQFTEPKDG